MFLIFFDLLIGTLFMGTVNTIGFCILGIPAYFFFGGIGFVLSTCFLIILLGLENHHIQTNLWQLLFVFLSLILFARGFGFLSGLYRAVGKGEPITVDGILHTGIVFYGGLFGFLISLKIILKNTKQNEHIIDLVAICIPLFHSMARIGCFFAGCCFGKEHQGLFSISYTSKIEDHILTVQRVPVQLIEACINFMIFLCLLSLYKTRKYHKINMLRSYLLVYSIVRFGLEFLRGDINRGIVLGISFSQLISIFLWIYLLATSNLFTLKDKEEINLWQ